MGIFKKLLTGTTPLHKAAKEGEKDVVDDLIAKGADVNSKAREGVTPLQAAAINGHKEIVELLISKGADVNLRDNRGGTAITSAMGSDNNCVDIVKILIAHGADLTAISEGGITELHVSVFFGKKEITELLIDNGANVNTSSSGGMTPLHAAAQTGNVEISKLLLKKGANINSKNDDGWSALRLAMDYSNQRELVKLLISNGADYNKDDVEQILSKGVTIEEIKQGKENRLREVSKPTKCAKCGSLFFEYDDLWKEYSCKDCGWITD